MLYKLVLLIHLNKIFIYIFILHRFINSLYEEDISDFIKIMLFKQDWNVIQNPVYV